MTGSFGTSDQLFDLFGQSSDVWFSKSITSCYEEVSGKLFFLVMMKVRFLTQTAVFDTTTQNSLST